MDGGHADLREPPADLVTAGKPESACFPVPPYFAAPDPLADMPRQWESARPPSPLMCPWPPSPRSRASSKPPDAATPEALSALLPLLYDELHALAHRQRLRQRGPETLNTTALLHEAYVKLARADGAYADREHFFRVAAQAMRQVLVDDARRRQQAAKRGGEARDATFEDGAVADPGRPRRCSPSTPRSTGSPR
jgi:hypothetical protein